MSFTKTLKITGLCAVALGILNAPNVSHADVFIWQDMHADVALSYPDRWTQVSNQEPHDLVTIAAPQPAGYNDNAQCKLNVKPDGRFGIYSAAYSAPIQHKYAGLDFWDAYGGRYDNTNFQSVKNDAGLARGHASFANFSYQTLTEPKMIRRAVGFATHYKNDIYVLECSSHHEAFEQWYPSFLSVAKSVFFDKRYPLVPYGFYRDYYDQETLIQGRRSIDVYNF